MTTVPHVFIDADACPVKEEVYRVAERYALEVTLVAASSMRIPPNARIALQVVEQGFDAADDWIAEHAGPASIVITADIPLAARCIAKGAYVLGTTGVPFTEANIGDTLATRDLMASLRSAGEITGGPAPFQPRDRSRFLQALDNAVHAVKRRGERRE
jgi:hypothetical protein